jgi:hypothetical protein
MGHKSNLVSAKGMLVVLVLCGSTLIANVNEGLISHWRFDEGSGSVAYDSAGVNDGIIYGATWTNGQIKNALSFDGLNDYVDMGDTIKNYLETSYTVSAWIKTNTLSAMTSIIAYRHSTGINPVLFALGQYYTDVHFAVRDNSHNLAQPAYPDALTTNTWYHVAGVREENTVSVYVNGFSAIPVLKTLGEISPDNLKIGAILFGGNPHTNFFDGAIDDVRIYDWALSAEEVQQLYESGLSILVDVDIKPGSCPNPLNVKSPGVLPVAVLGSEDFDVSTIDVASIRLAGVAPNRSGYEDVATPLSDSNECECATKGPDGFLDLTLKFEAQMIVEAIGEVDHGDELVLELTGVLSDETPIEGSDCVIIRGKHRPLNRADFNGDGIVDMADFAAFAENWLQLLENPDEVVTVNYPYVCLDVNFSSI